MADRTGSTSHRLTAQDSSFLYQESAVSQMHGAMIFFINGELAFDKLFRHINDRLHVSPRFRQRLFFPPFNLAHPTLEDDPDFSLENHVQMRALPRGVGEAAAVNEILRFNNSRLMDRSHPLWCLTLFTGLPGRSLVLFEMHHAIVDGVSGFDLLNRIMDFTPHPAPVEPPAEPWQPAPLPTPSESYMRAVRDVMVEQIEAAARSMSEFMRDPLGAIGRTQGVSPEAAKVMSETVQTPAIATPWNAGSVTEERTAAWLKLPFADFRAIRTTFGGTINDIVLTILAEGAAQYLKHHGWSTEGKLRIGCPVNVRRPDEQITLENRVSIMTPMTTAKPMDVVERLQSITAETKRIKDSGAPSAIERMMSANAVPAALAAALGRIGAQQMEAMAQFIKDTKARPNSTAPNTPVMGINFMATNVPGPQTAWYLAGVEVADWVCAVSLAGNLGLGVVITSYNQQMLISLVAEPRLLSDVDRLKGFVQEAFDELMRRVRQEVKRVDNGHSRVANG